MNNQRPYYTSASSSRNIPYSSYSSLANAGMSYAPTKKQSHSSSGQYTGPMQQPSSSRGHGQAAPQDYQPGNATPGYGMVAPAVYPDPAHKYHGFNTCAQYPTASYTPGSGGQFSNPRTEYPGSQPHFPPTSLDDYIAAVGGPVATSPYDSSQHPNNCPYGMGASTTPLNQYVSVTDDGFDVSIGIKQCYHCHTTTTPLWRRDPDTHQTLCNACGLYLQQRHAQRPQQLIDADHVGEEESDDASDGAPEGPECNHCHTRQTSVWRRDKAGNQVCNACGVYQRLRGKERPLSLKRNKVKPRTRSPQT
ncbi:hypothetical protein B0H12DRAFT_1223875 [Mycena haematopus]|nr:hypothetical protein B0H12DRAFT_1223875 [Mycena haematopus]